jgi:hypothetical protein
MVAQSLNVDRIKALTGTEADSLAPHFLQFEEQLAAIRSANPKCAGLSISWAAGLMAPYSSS